MPFVTNYRRCVPYILVLYFAFVVAVFLYFNMRLKVEGVALVLLGAAILSGRGLLFVRDWGVFFVVLMAWQVTSGLATQFAFPWHLQELIAADKFLFFGIVPSVWLQAHLYHPGTLEPWDVLAASMYMLHFLAPLAAAFAIWLANRQLYRKFAIAFVLVALAGFVTYILYPAVPPWYASRAVFSLHGAYPLAYGNPHGHVYLHGVQNLFDNIVGRWYNPYHGTIFLPFIHVQYDRVGAIPSEHAAYPMLFFLFLRRQFGRIAYLSLVYIALILFSITYLGQHYVIDAIVGFVYAGVGYALVMHAWPALHAWLMRRRERRSLLTGRVELPDLEEA